MAIKRQQPPKKIIEAKKTSRDSEAFEKTLRPKKLSEYIGQSIIKEHLIVHMEAARKRNESLGHTLLHGPPGLGKTTLAHIIAREMQSVIHLTSGPAIEKPGDLASLLTNLEAGDVLFIDEIHRLRPAIEEVLYGAMEEYALDLVIAGDNHQPTGRRVGPYQFFQQAIGISIADGKQDANTSVAQFSGKPRSRVCSIEHDGRV